MTDREKLELIGTMIADFWEFNKMEYWEKGALAVVSAISTIVDYGVDADGR